MAVYFYLSAECGSAEADANSFALQFKDIVLRLSSGIDVRCETRVTRDSEGNYWSDVFPLGAGYGMPKSADTFDPYLKSEAGLSEIGDCLYRHLCAASFFRYASYSAEPEQFLTYGELMAAEKTNIAERLDGLVVSDEIWQHAGEPRIFEPFSPGYRWQPFRGIRLT